MRRIIIEDKQHRCVGCEVVQEEVEVIEIPGSNPSSANLTVVFSLIEDKIQKTQVERWWGNAQLWLDFLYN